MKKKVLYLTFESIELSPIISTQVLPLLDKLSKHFDFELVTFEQESFHKPNSSKIYHSYYDIRNRISSSIKLLTSIYSNYDSYSLIHVRSYLPMLLLLCLGTFKRRKVPIIFDMRGVFPQELLMKNKYQKFSLKIHALYLVFSFLEKHFLKISNAIVVVSGPFENYLIEKYPSLKIKDKIQVIPTFTIPSSNLRLNEQPLRIWDDDAHVFVYSGSLYIWQQFEKTVELFKVILESLNGSKLLVLTFEKDKANEIIKDAGIDISDFRVITSKPENLQEFLKQAHFAFLLRDNDIVNKVATPIKFSDYVQANLSIIATPDIGDTEKIIKELGIGYIIPDLSSNNIKSFVREFAESVKSNGRKKYLGEEILKDKFSLAFSTSSYLKLYKDLSV